MPPPHLALLTELLREERVRLVGELVRWCRDVELAEDGLADACERALEHWAEELPRNPRAWLVTVARNRIRDQLGAAERTRTSALADDTSHPTTGLGDVRDDDTLAVLFACAHPALDRSVHAPLILQVAIGLATSDIATAFALPVSTLAKRLVRAKQKLRANRASFEIPETIDPERVTAVLEAIYAAYSIEWLRVPPEGSADLVTEQAVYASQLLLRALPGDHEVRGLAALLLFLQARSHARLRDGMLVPLDEQDPGEWDRYLIRRGERVLRDGLALARVRPPGPYELQAAIQSAHSTRIHGADAPVEAIAALYDRLVAATPSKGAAVARAAAKGRAGGAHVGLEILDRLIADDPTLETFQPYHATRAALLTEVGESPDLRRAALERAIELCTHPPTRRHLVALRETSV